MLLFAPQVKLLAFSMDTPRGIAVGFASLIPSQPPVACATSPIQGECRNLSPLTLRQNPGGSAASMLSILLTLHRGA